MPANTEPIFTLTPVIGMGQVSVANAGRDGSGTLATILTGGANGTRITKITVQALVTTTAGMIRLYIGDDAETPNVRLWKEVLVTAVTASGSVGAYSAVISLTGELALILPANYTLRASTVNAETFNVIAEGGGY